MIAEPLEEIPEDLADGNSLLDEVTRGMIRHHNESLRRWNDTLESWANAPADGEGTVTFRIVRGGEA